MKRNTRCPIAKALRSPHLRPKVVPSKKAFQRKPRIPTKDDGASLF